MMYNTTMENMVRTQIYLTKKQHHALKKIAAEKKTTLSQVLRDAAEKATKTRRKKTSQSTLYEATQAIFGIWSDRSDAEIAEFFDRKRELNSNREKFLLERYNDSN